MFDFGPCIGDAGACGRQPQPADLGLAVRQRLQEQGFCVLQPDDFAALCELPTQDCAPALQAWNDLPEDRYLKDGGHYRRRRHASFEQTWNPADATSTLMQAPHRPHYQPLTYNALHGGLVRWFEPIGPALLESACWAPMLKGLGRLFRDVGLHQGGAAPGVCASSVDRWCIEAHQFRIDTASGVGLPTPEGAHRDGVNFVAVVLAQRHAIRGGETRVFEHTGPSGVRFTLERPWSALLMDDTRVVHETTPVLALDRDAPGWRDTLVLTWRAGAFMDPPGVSSASARCAYAGGCARD